MFNAYIEMRFDNETELYESIRDYDIEAIKIPNRAYSKHESLFKDSKLNVELHGKEDELKRWLVEYKGIDEDEVNIFIQYYDSNEY